MAKAESFPWGTGARFWGVLWRCAPPEERVVDLARARRPLSRASRPIRFVDGGAPVVRPPGDLTPPGPE